MHSRNPLPILVLLLTMLILVACQPAGPGAQATATSAPAATSLPATATTPAQADPTATAETEPTAEPTAEPTPTLDAAEPTPDLEALRQDLASRLEVPVDSVSVVSTELLASPDLCLGVYDGSACHRVTLQVDGDTHVFHVNGAGEFSGVVEAVPAESGQIVLTFGRDDCQVAALRQETPSVGLGPCASEFTLYELAGDSSATQARLEEILSTYAPFTAATSHGFLSVGGSGAGTPDAQELDDIAAWVRDVVDGAVAQGPADDALCSRLARPALVTMSQGRFAIANPLTGEQCDLTLPGEWRGALQAGGAFLFFQDAEGGDVLVREMSPDGTLRPLDVTRTNSGTHSLLGFAVSPDGQTIAWSTATLNGQPGMTTSLFVAGTSDETAQTIVSDLSREDGRALIPLRFDESGQTLVYALQPYGVGGAWPSFVGRYDSLYTVPASGGEGQQHFSCPDLGLFLCVGDFLTQDGALQTIAYVQDNTVEIVDGQGQSIASIAMDAEYVAYPTFSPDGELVFYTATLGEGEGGFPFAEPGAYYRLAPPYDGEPALVAEQDGLLTPYQWFDAEHLIIGLGEAQGASGAALLGLDGSVTRLEPWPDTQAIAVIR